MRQLRLFFRRFVEKLCKGFTNAEKYGIIVKVFSVKHEYTKYSCNFAWKKTRFCDTLISETRFPPTTAV
ncbi:MAG: hypothetical protein EGP89_02785 [Ruminococcaceae bacterium]|nr:hypothetical protein [Oscillospiraceae bacterium]